MFAAAQILFENSGGAQGLEWLLAELPRRISRPVSRTEWRGFTTIVPQIRVETRPVALTIQFDDDAAYVPAEIEETAAAVRGRVDSQALAALQRCRARLDIMSATPVEPVVTQDTISVVAETDLDPASPEVAAVLRSARRHHAGVRSGLRQRPATAARLTHLGPSGARLTARCSRRA